MDNLEIRQFEVRFDEATSGEFTALAVPYGQEASIGGAYMERFAPGAIDSVEGVPIFYGHDYTRLPIGKAIRGEDTEAGYQFTAELTPGLQSAQDIRAALSHGTLNTVSVGFVPLESEKDGQTITRKRVRIAEISVVPFAAYSGAEIQEVRQEQESLDDESITKEQEVTLSENIELDVRQALDEVAELRRVVEANAAPAAPVMPEYQNIRSFGEYVKRFAEGDTAAVELARAASTSADTYAAPGFIGYINTLVNDNRPSWNVWSKAALPAQGMTVEYAKITANTLSVDEQDPENEALAFGNLTIDSVSTNVKTYGGYTTVSKQAVLRGSVDYVGQVFEGLAISYANRTNTAAKAAIAALDFTGKVMDLDGGTAASVIEGLIDGVKYIKQNSGLNAEFILCSADSYKYFMKIADSAGRPIVNVNNDGSNTFATAKSDLTGSIWGIPVIVDVTLGTGLAYLANSQALKVLEANGSGTRLTDSDVSTLTDTLSVYGFAAITAPIPAAIVKLDVTA